MAPPDRELLRKLKEFRRIATRYDKTDRSFAAMIYVAATIFVLR